MSDERSDEPHCDLRLWLLRCWGLKTTYSAKTGIERSFSLTGVTIDSGHGVAAPVHLMAPHFHNKGVIVTVCSPPRKFPQFDDSCHGCGVAWINAGVEPDEMHGTEPVRITIGLNDDAFDAFYRHASKADDDRRGLSANAVLVGPSLPSSPDPILGFLSPKDLDVSTGKSYVVSDFNISDAPRVDHLRDHLLRMPQERHWGDAARIAVQIVESQFEMGGEVFDQSISCRGRILGWGEPYSGVEVDITFSEFDPDELLERRPETKFSGTFQYWPKSKDEESARGGLSLRLRHFREDTRDILLSLLATPADCEVLLDVVLATETSEFREASDALKGNVRQYDLKVRRRLAEKGS